MVGPALAGVLIVTVGTTACFGLNALSYVAVIVALFLVRPRTAGGPPPPRRRGVKEGLRYAAGRQQLWLPLLMMLVVGLLAFNFSVILPVLAKDTFHGNGGTYGLLTTLLSVGSVLGSLSVGFIRHPRRQYLLFAALAFGVMLAATAAAPNVAVACVTLLCHRGGCVLLRHPVLDDPAAPQLVSVSWSNHGALGVRLPRHYAHRQHRDRLDHLGQWSEGCPPRWVWRLSRRGGTRRLRPYAGQPGRHAADLTP